MNDSLRKSQFRKRFVALVLMATVSACQTLKPAATKPESPLPPTLQAEPRQAPAPANVPTVAPAAKVEMPQELSRTLTRTPWSELPGWRLDNHAEALPALLASCRVLGKQAAWREACAAAPSIKGRDAARRFFENHFAPYRVTGDGSGDGFITGYYEPTLRGSRKPSERNRFPVYGAPDDLLVLELGELAPELKSALPRVRVEGKRVVPYHARAQIDSEEAPLRGKEIAWVEDAIELFFLQVQGSGRIALDEGGVMRVGFAGHNGHPYRSIGRMLIERGDLTMENASMQGIKGWARTNPSRLTELLNQNPRYVFFRELPGNGAAPPGALGVPLTPERSIAVDPRYLPLGAPVHIATTWPNTDKPLQRLMLAQDTGGAIRGAVRADFFWGAGEKAAREAGRMQQALRMWVLLPNGYPVSDLSP